MRWKIYLSLTGILLPVFALTILVQTIVTRPLLEEEVRQIGTSVCRSLSTDIVAFRLLTQPNQLERRLIEMSWLQPSVVRLDVLVREKDFYKVVASSVTDDPTIEVTTLDLDEAPKIELKEDSDRRFWAIFYPIKERKKVLGYVHAEVSLQLVDQVVGIFSKLAFLGAFLAIALLIGLLSYYLRRMIENERKLRRAESENVELTEQLHETQRQLFLNEKLAIMGQLTASFAHEIGTPLNSVSGHLQLLQSEVKSEGSRGRLDIINSQVSRIEGIVKDFLASTHTPARQRQLVDVLSLIERITKLVAPRIATIRAEVKIVTLDGLQPIRIVPTDLEQVLLNLTNNAIDALEKSPNSRRLQYHAQTSKDAASRQILEITVEDTGEGIAPTELKQVLKPFYTTKAPGQGTGLGLTISQRLIKKYGGRLELDSVLGKGTVIKVSIPYETT
ncbi:MAG: ATP-binding protein [Bdellovibrionota bacterium]